jgi:hypothetical protein
MANMSYCRFRNTLADFKDCRNALEELMYEESEDTISDEEADAAEEMVMIAFGLIDELGFITEDGEFNYEECRIFFERLKDGCQ